MGTTRCQRWLIGVSLALVATVLFAACLTVRHAILVVRCAFVEEQTDIFLQMRNRALELPATEAAECLDYVTHYYCSGTKQFQGSALDQTVERFRNEMIRQIIEYLREKTGKNLGTDPQPWINEFSTHRRTEN